jgi:DNA repair exonuclease SbcCD ATPase subunit
MKKGLYFIVALIFIGCQEEPEANLILENNKDSVELISLRNQIAQLTLENEIKDSVLNQSFSFFNEIQENLARISVKEDLIRIKSSNPEMTSDDKDWIIQEINNINYLREQNAKKVRDLQGKVKDQAFKIVELEAMIDRLVLKINSNDEKIESLQNQLADRDVEFSELFDQYHEQVELALEVLKELNTVYFAYGTIQELEENQVLVREGGFIGIGKQTNIAENLNQKYFKKLDKTKTKELTIIGKKPQLVTDHPGDSYEWKGNKLVILDASKFWRISNYLVVTVK